MHALKGQVISMRILHVINDATIGGAQTLVEALSRAAFPKHTVHLLVLLGEGDLSQRFEDAAESVTYVHMNRRNIIPFRAIRTLVTLVKTHHIDVVHSHLYQSDLVNILAPHGRPRVSTLHVAVNVASNAKAQAVWRLTAALSKRFDAVVACSEAAVDFAKSMKYRYTPDSMPVIYNGAFTSAAPTPWPNNQVMLYPARYVPAKDHPTLFRAFAQVAKIFPAAQLRCAGQNVDNDNRALTTLLDELGIRDRVCLLGPINNVRDEIRKSTAVVFSSWHEALPMAGLEAISEGVPFVTTDSGNAPSLAVAPEAVVPMHDADALAGAMTWLLSRSAEDHERLRRLSWRLAVETYDVRRTFDRYNEVYEEVCG